MEVEQAYYGRWVFNDILPLRQILNLGPHYRGYDLVRVELDVDARGRGRGPGRDGVGVGLLINGRRVDWQPSARFGDTVFEMRGIQRLGIEINTLQAQINGEAYVGRIRVVLRRNFR